MTTRMVGEPVQRVEDRRLLTGGGRFLDDLGADAVEVAVVRSPHAHAKILDIDVTGALEVEGLLASFPYLAANLDIERLPFPRPRQAVIALLGEENQSLPALIFGDGAIPDDAERHGEVAFIKSTRRILDLLAERHGFPRLHG